MFVSPFHVLGVGSFLPLLRIAVGETGIVHGIYVTQVTLDIHHLVVTEQAYYPAACLCRFFLEGHHQVHDLARFRATIQEIPDLDERCLTACPMILLIYEIGAPENCYEVVKVIVDIGDDDYGFWRFCCSPCWFHPG